MLKDRNKAPYIILNDLYASMPVVKCVRSKMYLTIEFISRICEFNSFNIVFINARLLLIRLQQKLSTNN